MALMRARQLLAKKRYLEALLACRKTPTRGPEWHALMDEICMHSAATGNVIGFDGRVLQVQAADPATAWLGPQLPSDKSLPANTYSSIADALQAATDGDTIQLLPGTHVVSQVCLRLEKRVVLAGVGGGPQDVVLDHRANHAAFNITRCCILRNFSIDMVGFCEAMSICSPNPIKPILQHLSIQCSGDDGLLVGGAAQPLLHDCHIQVRHCGMKQYGSSTSTLWRCSMTGCTQGLMLCDSSQAFLENCTVQQCSEDGVVVLQQAALHLTNTSVTDCKGPGIDMADESTALLKHVEVRNCCGGIWLWQNASCEAVSCYISGGSSYAVLLDAQAYTRGSSCTIDGPCHDSSEQPLPQGPDSPRHPTARNKQQHSKQHDLRSQSDPPVRGFQQHQQPASAWQPTAGAAAASTAAIAGAFASSLVSPTATVAAMASPYSNGSCSEASSRDVMMYCREEGWGTSGSGNSLVDSSMLVHDPAKAAALFPPEQGAFAVETRLY